MPGLFLKLDISKAFDSVGWAYLLEVLQQLGFGQRWRDWICMTLASSSSRVLLNGEPGTPFAHGKGLRQGDPVSPMLFILAIDPLQLMFRAASQAGILKPIRARMASCRVSLYADDAGIFANPVKEEIDAITRILACFGDASGPSQMSARPRCFPFAAKTLISRPSSQPSRPSWPRSPADTWVSHYIPGDSEGLTSNLF